MALKSRRVNENVKLNKVYLSQKLKCAGRIADLTENAPYINSVKKEHNSRVRYQC